MLSLTGIKSVLRHPLTAGYKWRSLKRYAYWQLGSRLVPGPVAVPFVNGSKLLAQPGLHGATGNAYLGLHEFEDMAFVLHCLRPGDVFVDIGANVGSYTVLAATVGAHCVAFEPVPSSFEWLTANIGLNRFAEEVNAQPCAVGDAEGTLTFTTSLDSMNHVVAGGMQAQGETISVHVVTLDGALDDAAPAVLKIDVEGYETAVLNGAQRVLARPSLLAVVMELNGSGRAYGYDEEALHRTMLGHGFAPYAYVPLQRVLTDLNGNKSTTGNTLYLRNPEVVRKRLKHAPPFHVFDRAI